MTIDLINHKGTQCKEKDILCQEGYCSECYIPRKIKIAVDVDGVITAYPFKDLVKQYFGVDIEAKDLFAYDLADVLGISSKEINTMFQEQVFGKPKFNDNAIKILRFWRQRGIEIIIYTNRVKYMTDIELVTWLLDNGIPFSGIDSNGYNEYDIHIDDSPAKLAATNSKLKLLYSQPWNERCLDVNKQLIRVKDWNEVNEYVEKYMSAL